MKRSRVFLYIALAILLLAQPALGRPPVPQLPTRAGTVISNQASVSYNNLAGVTFQALSNIVVTVVATVPGVDITDGTHVATAPGTSVVFYHMLTNTGNAPEAINVFVFSPDGFPFEVFHDSDFDMNLTAADAPFGDSDGDGLPDTGEMDLGVSMPMLLKVTIPPEASLSVEALFAILASSSLDESVTDYAEDLVSVDEARPYVDVHGSPEYAYLGTEYEFEVSFGNNGDIPFTSAMLEVPLPELVEFVSADGSYVFDPVGRTLTWNLGSIAAGASGSFTVRVRANSTSPGITYVKNEANLTGDVEVSLNDFEMTGLVTRVPATLVLTADPDTLISNGYSQSLITATVLDVLGNPVPDGTPVEFGSELGTFLPSGTNAYIGTTAGGIAQVLLVSPLIHGFENVLNDVTAHSGDPVSGEAFDTVTITYIPAGIMGIVWNSETEAPVPDVLVELLDGEGAVIDSTFTGEDGRYMMYPPEVGLYRVRIHTEGAGAYGPVEMEVEVRLEPGAVWSTPGAIIGVVYFDVAEAAASSLEPYAGAEIYLYKDGEVYLQTTANEDGEFFFLNLPMGDYVLKAVSPEGHVGFSGVSVTEHGEVIIAELIELYDSGKVYDESNGAPIPGAEVTLLYASGPLAGTPVPLPATPSLIEQDNPMLTDLMGLYIFFVEEGEYVLRATAFGYEDYESEPFTLTGPVVNAWIPMQLIASEELSITKDSSRSTAAPDETFKFTVTWSNTSGGPLTDVTVVDKLPVELIVEEDTITGGGIYNPIDHSITWYYGYVNPSAEPHTEAYFATVYHEVDDGRELLNIVEVTARGGYEASTSVMILIARKPGILVDKEAGASTATTGDIVTYRIKVVNSEETDFPMAAEGVEVVDTLPAGFSYLPGSTYVDGEKAADPVISGGTLKWFLGSMKVGEEHEIFYKAGVGAGAVLGADSVNSAMVYGFGELGFPFEVGPASASVLVTGPAFSSLGTIIGKVFDDKDADGFQDKGEEGIYGAELVMDDGMRVLTDKDGLYHIGQVKPGVRSIKLNMSSLPFKGEMTVAFKDILGKSSSLLMDVYPSGVVRADFAVRKLQAAAAHDVEMGMAVEGMVPVKDGSASVLVKLSFTNKGKENLKGAMVSLAAASSDEGAEVTVLNNGLAKVPELMPGQSAEVGMMVNATSLTEDFSSVLLGAAVYMPGEGTDAPVILDRVSTAAVLYMRGLGSSVNGFAITVPGPISLAELGHIAISTESPLAIGTKLLVNGVEVPKDRIGKSTSDGIQGKMLLEYISVEIETGENLLELVDAVTGQKVASAIVLKAGQAAEALVVRIPTGEGRNTGSKVAVAALSVDALGLPAGKFMGPTFKATGAEFVGEDANLQDEGFQTIAGDLGNYDLLLTIMDPQGEIGLAGIVGDNRAEADLSGLKPQSKPAFVAGTIELTHNLGDFYGSYIRARAFLRKEFTGGVLILRYDSEQGVMDGMYSDAADDTMYRLYGDLSAVDNASPAASPFYAKLTAGPFYAMWGDFQPMYQKAELSSFKSKFTGLSLGVNLGGFTLGGFVAPVMDGITTDRIEADGTSGYFFLDEFPLLSGSEAVYVILVSGLDEDVVLERVALKRASDYMIDYQNGTILLSKPVPTGDGEGNKYFIEVAYTTAGTDIKGLAAGVRLHADFGAVDAGLTASMLSDFAETDAVAGADLGLDFGDPFRFNAEAAVSFGAAGFGGYAAKAGATSKIGKVMLGISATATDGGFVKPGETSPMAQQIMLGGKVALDEELPIILQLSSTNYWKGAAFDFSSDNKLKVGYRLPLNFNLALGLVTTFTYDGPTDTKGAIFDAFVEIDPIPELSIVAYAQIARVGEPVDNDGDYSLAITYKPNSKVGITLSYVTGLRLAERYHTIGLNADIAVTKNGKVYGKLDVPFGTGAAKVLSLGYSDAYQLCQGLKADFLLEGAVGFKEAGLDAGTTRVSAAGALEYTAKNGFRAYLKQEVTYEMADGFKSLTKLTLSGKPADWLTVEGNAGAYYGNSPSREGLPLTAEADLSLAARPQNTIYTGLLKVGAKYYMGESFGIDEAAVVATAVTDWTLEAGRFLSLTAKAGYKLAAEGPIGEGLSLNHILLLQGGVSLHITKTTDIEGFVRSIGWVSNWKLGYSVQIVQKIFNLFSVAVGYNSKDLADTDIVDQKPWTEGFYLKAMIKF